jgi:hypothetical protein
VISIASLVKGVLEGQELRQVREDRDVLQSKAVVARASPVAALSRGSLVVWAVPRLKGMTGNLEALPHMSLAWVLQNHPAVTAKILKLSFS